MLAGVYLALEDALFLLHPPSCVLQQWPPQYGVVCVALKVSESGLSCCWVTELQGGPITSFRMVGHMGGIEAVGS